MSVSETHLDDEQIALLALGEPLASSFVDHLSGCRECGLKFAASQRVVAAGKGNFEDSAELADPSPQVWTRISQELQLEPEAHPQLAAAAQSEDLTVVRLEKSSRRWPTAALVAASVASVVVGAAVAVGGVALTSDQQPTPSATSTGQVLEQAALVALPNHVGSGTARVVQTARGSELVVDVEALSGGNGFHEVWLIDPKTMQMVGLGALNANAGRFPIPDGLDLSQYSLVDVSVEPFDGDPTHSGDSVVRGQLAV